VEGVAEDPRALADIEIHQVRAAQARAAWALGVRRCQPQPDQPAGRRPRDHVEAVGDPPLLPRLLADQLLEPLDHPRGDQPPDPPSVDGEDAEAVRRLLGH
jgi:hypothetical protein